MSKNQFTRESQTDAIKAGEFSSFMRRLMAVPHSEIKERLDSEKEAKRKAKVSSSVHVSDGKD